MLNKSHGMKKKETLVVIQQISGEQNFYVVIKGRFDPKMNMLSFGA